MKINKILPTLFLILTLVATGNQNSYSQQFNVGDKDLNMSVGYGTPWVFREGYQTNMLPIGLSFDYGITDRLGPGILSAGGYLGATTYSEEFDNPDFDYGRKGTLVALAFRSSYHYKLTDEADTYAFLHLGVGRESWSAYGNPPANEEIDTDSVVRAVFGLGIGAKYYFSENLCALVEIGYSTSFFKIGIGIRL